MLAFLHLCQARGRRKGGGGGALSQAIRGQESRTRTSKTYAPLLLLLRAAAYLLLLRAFAHNSKPPSVVLLHHIDSTVLGLLQHEHSRQSKP